MATLEHTVEGKQRSLGKLFTWILRFGLAILIPLIAFSLMIPLGWLRTDPQ